MQQQILVMLELQEAMNCKVHPDWRKQGFAWHRAIWVESAELLEHHGWKWWKKQTADRDQIALELVDIWHFGLSMELEQAVDLELLAARLADNLYAPVKQDEFCSAVEAFVAAVLKRQGFPVGEFSGLMKLCDLSFSRLYGLYIGKNILNFFRQDHGYKDGSYQKLWQGKEDNEHLMEILAAANTEALDFKEQLYRALEGRYAKGQSNS